MAEHMTTPENAPTIGATLPFFGGKRTMARTIVGELGPHSAYWEVFGASLAVLIAKPRSAMETANDLFGEAMNLARVIQDERCGSALYRRLRRTLMHETLFHEAAARCRERGLRPAGDPDVDWAYDAFVSAWMGRNGVYGTQSYNCGFSHRYTKNGGHAAKRFASAVDSIPAIKRRLRGVTILSRCGIKLCERIEDADGTVIYADPPYLVKGAKYKHDFTEMDHERLAAALRRFKRTRVVVSYYAHPRLDELYPGWTAVDCTMTKSMVSQGMRDARGVVKAPEVLLINKQSLARLPMQRVAT